MTENGISLKRSLIPRQDFDLKEFWDYKQEKIQQALFASQGKAQTEKEICAFLEKALLSVLEQHSGAEPVKLNITV